MLDFLEHPLGEQSAEGSLFINIADYSSLDIVPQPDKLIQFAKEFRSRARNPESDLFFTYGDVTKRDGNAMITFTNMFFRWIGRIPISDADQMGRIGLSYDVERFDPEIIKKALLLGQELRRNTPFGEDNVVIQVTVDGDRYIVGTDYTFRYADSVLVMLYSNHLTAGSFPPESNLTNQIRWLLTEQCEKCLRDD